MLIGVAVSPRDLPIAREFFELFKIAWEPLVPGRRYRVVLDTTGAVEAGSAEILLAYGPREQQIDRQAGFAVTTHPGPLRVGWDGQILHIDGPAARFDGPADAGLLSRQIPPLGYYRRERGRRTVRVGYDVFGEARSLLTAGQPSSRAAVPTLDLHIDLLRALLLEAGASVVEIPPRPFGSEFICCLTHDIDFVGIRRHWMDRTLAGFSARASVGTVADVLGGRRPTRDLARNATALLSLPLVFSGLLPDLWRPFEDYLRADGERASTFFVIPFKGRPGTEPGGGVEDSRAAPYDLPDVADDVRMVASRGKEVAVHGIDAWRDAEAGRAELQRMSDVTGSAAAGVRMHWLYFDADSPGRLEAAGFEYDSSWGYNDGIGFRAGTSQAFCFPQCSRLLELPLAIMDTAMFYPDRMGLTSALALERCGEIVAHARTRGGTVVVNWHDRSLAPERLWDREYRALLDLIGGSAWFATARDAVAWFRWRRSVRFAVTGDEVTVAAGDLPPGLPGGLAWVHTPGGRRALALDGRGSLRLTS
jgi:hypothetical protein